MKRPQELQAAFDAQSTPGPWKWGIEGNLLGADESYVMEVVPYEGLVPPCGGDVDLIAAAPTLRDYALALEQENKELREALSLLVSILPDESYLDSEEKKIARHARQALAKLGGER